MEIEHVNRRIEQQGPAIELLVQAYENLIRVGIENITRQRIDTRLQALHDQWQKISANHDAIEIAIFQLEPHERDLLMEKAYFQERQYQVAYETYLDTAEKITRLQTDNVDSGPRPAHSVDSLTTPTTVYHGRRLPRIDVPKFDGSLNEWLSFRDLFSSLILSDTNITPVEKLQYLKMSVVGSAEELLRNTALTADNFQKAWDTLSSFYENKRLLVNAALQSLMSTNKMTKESATEMKNLYNSVTQSYRTLETLQRPVQHWDDILVFLTTERLDAESAKTWEHHLGASKDPPTWEKLKEFLMTRLLSLQAFEKTHHPTMTVSPAIKPTSIRAHYSGQGENATENPVKELSCYLCAENHYISRCPTYQLKSTTQRKDYAASNGLCFNCLGRHRIANCKSTRRCNKCGQRHHSSLHQSVDSTQHHSTTNLASQNASTLPQTGTTPQESAKQVHHAQRQSPSTRSVVFLATAQAYAIDFHGQSIPVRILLDQGSEISLITENLAQRSQIARNSSSVPLLGVGSQKPTKTRGIVTLKLKSCATPSNEILLTAHILPHLTSTIPSVNVESALQKSHLQNLTLADPAFSHPGSIDVIIGADLYGQLLEGPIIQGPPNAPIAQLTKLGWIISGPSTIPSAEPNTRAFHCSIDNNLQDLLEKFWKLEEVNASTTRSLSTDDQACDNYFAATYTRDKTGRYTVRLPFKGNPSQLGVSRPSAEKMLTTLQRKLTTDPVYFKAYASFLAEYENVKHMIRCPKEYSPKPSFYLPHHGVLRESSASTKLRVVFNGSCRVTEGIPLNSLLHAGPKLQLDIFEVLLWNRQYKFTFSADIEKMFRQIQIHPDDWTYQRILWQENGRVLEYLLTTVTYGTTSAPYLAWRTIQQLITDESHNYPEAIEIMSKGRYVDDIWGGADTIAEAKIKSNHVDRLCKAGGFPLKKRVSNHPDILMDISPENKLESMTMSSVKGIDLVNALGLKWNATQDNFQFDFKPTTPSTLTKRAVLSVIAQFFDPLGFLSPLIIRAKIFMQDLWVLKISWDSILPVEHQTKWNQLIHDLGEISKLRVPRWVGTNSNSQVEIHGFCDASQKAMAAVVYLRTLDSNQSFSIALACSKTKVAPVKKMTIPRLELSSAVMLTRLIAHVKEIQKLDQAPCFLWTDSSIALTWINNHPSRWKEFVHNRVCFIQETLPHAVWRHVAGDVNPADCATRGLTSSELREFQTWWTGPPWLNQESSRWPNAFPERHASTKELEECQPPANVHAVLTIQPWHLLIRYSSMRRLLRTTVMCRRIVSLIIKPRPDPRQALSKPMSLEELEQSHQYWIKIIQRQHFFSIIRLLKDKRELPTSENLSKLIPFLDNKGLLRVGGRLNNSSLTPTAKNPYILPKDSHFTILTMREAHEKTLHGSTQDTLTYLRNTYWIVGGRTTVRSFLAKCVRCARFRRMRPQQLIGQLPASRVTESTPFCHSGVDYAGPFEVKTWRGRAARTYKAWVALFVCLATSAIHLELVSDYSTDAFLAAFKRFTGRRGICVTLRSDCGTNFKGADKELKKLFNQSSAELDQLAKLLADCHTQWIFNPPASPHFEGKWEAGVNSMKHHLKRVVGETKLTAEELTTVLIQIEAVLNSRPICPLTEDPEDLEALTPGHFLIGRSLTLIPEPNLELIPKSRLSRWQHLTQLLQSIWTRWSKEYLHRFHTAYKWTRPSKPLPVGSLVFVMDERYPPAKWPLGRILKNYPGPDGVIQVADVKTSTSTLTRPVIKLCPLPLSDSADSVSLTGSTKAGGNVQFDENRS